MNKEEIAFQIFKKNGIYNEREEADEQDIRLYNTIYNKLEPKQNNETQLRIDKAINFINECIENKTNCSQSFEYFETDNEIQEIHKYFIDSEMILQILKGE